MRAVALYGTIGSLVLSALTAAPAAGAALPEALPAAPGGAAALGAPGGITPVLPDDLGGAAEARGTAMAAERAEKTGVDFARCPAAEKLPKAVRCGTVSVPLDYARPEDRQITLTVSRIRATGDRADHQGALVYNPGGPGASGMQFPLYRYVNEWAALAGAYDFVGYAPRGVGRSAPLSCQSPTAFTKAPTLAQTDPTEAYKEQRREQAAAYARGCSDRNGPQVRHYTSLNNARDLEVIRAALGEKKLNFVGASYGTYIGALYATLHPERVRRMVFDSAVNPDPQQIWYRANLEQSRAFETRWEDWRRWVAEHDDTYHLGDTAAAVLRSYRTARERLDREPAGGKVGSAQLHAAFLGVGYYDWYWPRRAKALSEYLRGNPGPLVEQAAPRVGEATSEENSNAVYTAVECNDAPWPRDWAVWDRDNTALARVAPFETWDNAWMNLPCATWSEPRQEPLDVGTEPGALPPVLILAAERDAATPYEGALELRRRLPGSSLVTERDAGTHGIAGGENDCVNRHLEAYLLRGETPGRGAECAPHAEPKPETARSGERSAPRPLVVGRGPVR